MQATEIDLVIPVLNPPSGWAAQTSDNLARLVDKLGEPVHLVISNDGSSDESEIKLLQDRLPQTTVVSSAKNRGKGHALRLGMKRSTAKYAIFTDADFPYEIESMVRVIVALKRGADVALGHRQQNYYNNVPRFRRDLSEAFRFVLRSLLRFPITDTQCGLKGMNAKGREVFLKTNTDRFLVDMEFIKLALNTPGLVVETVDVNLRDGVKFSSMGPGVLLREILNFVRIMFR
ncbi:MAG: glycosyltransferase family 2 protein [Salibacteraceae bacterium]